MADTPIVVVEPLLVGGGRPVRVRGEVYAVARGRVELERVLESIRHRLSESGEIDEELPVEWHGGGLDAW
ncbi:hypothetical protein [Streptomyces sp. NBC_01497]|uniref:hypothetical protein n=1 Tax=Streptomyces sp. NBC_01497 TaxID=2903885 RepID=UPI002E3579A4|nr:hypothetical protein [Streptomyces sp. NBC_01497]